MHFSVDASDARRMAADLRSLGKQASFAHVVALTRTAVELKKVEQAEMRRVFDRPTSYTLNSVFVKPATKAAPSASIGLKDELQSDIPAAYYVGPNIQGGSRANTRFEKRLQLDGQMQRGWYAVPNPRFARLDQHGNLSRGQITQILSQLTKTKVSGYTADISPRSRKGAVRRAGQFIALPNGRGKLRPGIYSVSTPGLARKAKGVGPFGRTAPRAIVYFVKRVAYRQRFDFFGVAERAAPAIHDAQLDVALAQYVEAGSA